MAGNWIVLHLAVAVAFVIVLILRFRVDPTLSLILGSIYLGLTGGLGFAGTVEAITTGFGELMAELGLLIGFGILLGSLLLAIGALQGLVHMLLRAAGRRGFPYAFGVALCAIFPSVIPDIQFILGAPMIQSAARRDEPRDLPRMTVGMIAGSLVGLVLVVPGLGTVAIAGILGVPLGTTLLYGFIVGPLTTVITIFVATRIVDRIWRPATDVIEEPAPEPEDGIPSGGSAVATAVATERRQGVLLPVLLTVFVPVALIVAGSIADAATAEPPAVLALISHPVFALLAGVLVAYVFARRRLASDVVDGVMSDGFKRAGNVLLVTGAGGAFGTTIAGTELADVVGRWFSGVGAGQASVIVLVAWVIAALAHLGVGSISVAAITAAGIVTPLIGASDVSHVVVAMAIAAGAMFAVHINSNGFWLIRSLLGLSTRGALKAVTLVSSVASVVALALVLVVSVVV